MNFVEFISKNAEIIIGMGAFGLAVRAYVSSERSKYENFKSLLLSFKKELEFQSDWIGKNVYTESFIDKCWFNPNKMVYVLSFETGKELLRRGVVDGNFVDNDFYNTLAIFIERIDAFNSMVVFQQNLISSNVSISQKLIELLETNKESDYCDLRSIFYRKNKESGESEDKKLKEEPDEFLLARALYKCNYILHIKLIGDGVKQEHLRCMFNKLNKYIDEAVDEYESRIPFWFRKISSFRIR